MNAVAIIVQIVTGALLLNSLPKSPDQPSSANDAEDGREVHFNAPSNIGQVFPQVQNEGIVSLVLLVTSEIRLGVGG